MGPFPFLENTFGRGSPRINADQFGPRSRARLQPCRRRHSSFYLPERIHTGKDALNTVEGLLVGVVLVGRRRELLPSGHDKLEHGRAAVGIIAREQEPDLQRTNLDGLLRRIDSGRTLLHIRPPCRVWCFSSGRPTAVFFQHPTFLQHKSKGHLGKMVEWATHYELIG